jgi:hypothetical protein
MGNTLRNESTVMNFKGFPQNFWKGFIVIIIAYTIVQLFFNDIIAYLPLPFKINRQFARWLTIFFIYVTGTRVLKSTKEAWMLAIWHIIHLGLIGFLMFIAFYEYFIAPVTYGIRASVAPIIEFLISPVLYMSAGLIYKAILKNR